MTARRQPHAHRPASRRREAIQWLAFLVVLAGVLVALTAVPPEWLVR